MNEQINTVGITLPENEKMSSGIGYIALPKDINRETYLRDCYQNFRISIHTAHDGFMNRVHISPDDLNFIEFPTDHTKMGTPVYYIVDPINNQPYVVKRYHTINTIGAQKENQFVIGKLFGKSFVEISGNPEEGFLNLNVTNDTNSEVNIVVNNKSNKGKLNLAVRGSMNLFATTGINLTGNTKFYSKVSKSKKESINTEVIQTVSDYKINTPTFALNNGEENMMLGQKFKTLFSLILDKMSNFVTEVSNATVITMLGTQPLLNRVQIAAYSEQIRSFKDEIDDCLSQVGFIDK